jgi:hypothetical protein
MSLEDQELRDLVDRQAIQELVSLYCRAVDRQDFALLRTLYTADGQDDHGTLYKGGAQGYFAWLQGVMEGKVETTHHVHNHLIVLQGRGEAEGELCVTAHNRMRNAAGGFDELVQGLRYFDRYRKEAGRWRFASRTLAVDWSQEGGPVRWGPQDDDMHSGRPGKPDASDASYAALSDPLFKRHG